MLMEVRQFVGFNGLIQILLDSFSEKDLDRFEKDAGCAVELGASALSRAENIARLACKSSALQSSLTDALDRKNASLTNDLSGLSSEDLLRDYSPQNADFTNAPGCLLWSLFRSKDNEDCLRLLQIWNDYLVNRSSSERPDKERKANPPTEESFERRPPVVPLHSARQSERSPATVSPSPTPDWLERVESGQQRLLAMLDGLTARIGKIEAELEAVQRERSSDWDALPSSVEAAGKGKKPEDSVPAVIASREEEPVEEALHPIAGEKEEAPFPDVDGFRSEHDFPASQIASRTGPRALKPEPVLRQETLVLVGGMDRLVDEYRKLIEGLGGSFERYSSVDEFSLRWLEGLVDRVHLIIVLGNAATRPGTFRLMEIAERLGRRLCVHHSTAPASLYRLLTRMVEREEV